MSQLNPRVDFAFKKLFGSEGNQDLLESLVNAVLSPNDQVTSIELKNPYNLKDFASDKMSILDIKATDRDGRTVTIEMQIADQLHYEKRALFLWSEVYAGQLKQGDGYSDLKKTIAIHILNFNLMDEPNYHNLYRIKNDLSHRMAFGDFQLHTIELKKFDHERSGVLTALDRWVKFLTRAHEYSEEVMPQELAQDPAVKKAITVLETLYLNDMELEFYRAQLKWLRDKDAAIQKAELRGSEKGREKGREEGQRQTETEMIRRLNAKGLSFIEIAQWTEISEERIIQVLNVPGIFI